MEKLAYFVLPVLMVTTAFFFVRDKRQYEVFKSLDASEARRSLFRRWVVESLLLYGLMAILCLFLLGHASALTQMPDAFNGLATSLRSIAGSDQGGFWNGMFRTIAYLVPVLVIAHTISALLRTYTAHKNRQIRKPQPKSDSRDIQALFPRNRRERYWTTLLSINAGFSEELFFRLLAPLLFWIVTGNALFAVIAATVWFGLAHYYQGWVGIVVTCLAGALFMCVYLYTGSIWWVVVMHAVVDLNDLSFAPWFADWLEARSPTASDAAQP